MELAARQRLPSQRNGHGVAPERNAALVMLWTPLCPFTRTSSASDACQFTPLHAARGTNDLSVEPHGRLVRDAGDL